MCQGAPQFTMARVLPVTEEAQTIPVQLAVSC
jgi:hypothetical protein